MSENESESKEVYVFRCNDSALYAFTADSSGHFSPSKLYQRINWRLERRVTLHCNHNSDNAKVTTATLKAIVEYGFYLTPCWLPAFQSCRSEPGALRVKSESSGVANPRPHASLMPAAGLAARG